VGVAYGVKTALSNAESDKDIEVCDGSTRRRRCMKAPRAKENSALARRCARQQVHRQLSPDDEILTSVDETIA